LGDKESFTAKLDIRLVTPSMYRQMIELAACTPRTAICAVGGPGIGKSAIPRQVARKRGAPYVALHIPQMATEDWYVPTSAPDTRRYYDRRIPRRFQQLLEFVERVTADNDGKFPEGRNPILAIEEINRAAHKQITQAAFTLLEDRVIGDTHIPDEIQLIVTMNPSGGGMSVNQFERDPAHRRRLLMVGVTASYPDFIQYVREAGFHPQVREYLEAQPTAMYDEPALLAGKAYACPASWETVTQVCYELDRNQVALTSSLARALIAGKIGLTATEAFLDFVDDKAIIVTADEILQGYFETSTVRERVRRFVREGRNDKIASLLPNVAMKIFSATNRRPESYGRQLALFLADLPEDATVAFIKTHLKNQSIAVDGGRAYFVRLSQYISTEPAFNEAAERLRRAQASAAAEAQGAGMKSATN
jgi:MoxR-like ATPase